MLEVLGEQVAAPANLSSGRDERVPERQSITILDSEATVE